MIGAIIGDIVGSIYESDNIKSKNFELFSPECFFTDDTVMTIAVGKALMNCRGNYEQLEKHTIDSFLQFGKMFPAANYGLLFYNWLFSDNRAPYHSYGNGAPMRVSACGIVGKTVDEVITLSRIVTGVTHNHPDALHAAEAVAVSVFLARSGKTKQEIYEHIIKNYYALDFKLDDIRETYTFSEKAIDTTPPALVAFFESVSFEDAIRNAISIGGDSDTIAAITGSIAAEYYGVPKNSIVKAKKYLSSSLRQVIDIFENDFTIKSSDL